MGWMDMTEKKTSGAMDSLRLSAAVLGLAAVLAAGVAEAARTVNQVGNIPCPAKAGDLIDNVSVRVNRTTSPSNNDWYSTQFTWGNGSETFVGCSNDPRPNVTSGTGNTTSAIDTFAPIAPPTGGGYTSVTVEAFNQDDCNGTGGGTFIKTIPACSPTTVQNPDLAPGCGQDIILVLDESRSISTSGGVQAVIDGAKALLRSIADTGSAVSVIEFGNEARLAQIGTFTPGDYVDVTSVGPSPSLPAFEAYLDNQSGGSDSPAGYNPAANPVQYTNWQDAFQKAAGVMNTTGRTAAQVVVLTDGLPTTDNVPGNGCDLTSPSPSQCMPPAVAAADAVKTTGAHVFVIGVGNNINVGNIQLISGPDEVQSGATIQDVVTGDFTLAPFAALGELFRKLAFAVCSPSLTVTKLVDPDGPGGQQLPVATSLVRFDADVAITQPGQTANNFEWVNPQAAASCPTAEAGKGCPGPGTADGPDNRGTAQFGWTGNDGSLNFGWVPNDLKNPELWQSRIVISEDLSGQVFRELVCERRNLNLLTGVVTVTDFSCLPVNTCEPQGGTECASRVVCRDLDQDGPVIVMEPGDIVTCTAVNDAQLDYGDAPDTGTGTGTGNYQTTLADNGPSHAIGGISLRPETAVPPDSADPPDAEADGQPSVGADGDDTNRVDDENGVLTFPAGFNFTAGRITNVIVSVTGGDGVQGTVDAVVSAWFDWNQDGDFDDAGEAVAIDRTVDTTQGGSGQSTDFALPVAVPATAVPGTTYARFRVTAGATGSTNSNSPTGPAGEGEVEDHKITVVRLDFGDAPDSYGTKLVSNGARHVQDPTVSLRLGAEIDTEGDGAAAVTADQDDVNPLGSPDDEDGVTFKSFAGPGFPIEATVTGRTVANTAYLCAYLDGAADAVIDGRFTRAVSYTGDPSVGILRLTGTASAGNEEICVAVQGTAASSAFTSTTTIPASSGFNGAEASCSKPILNQPPFNCTIKFNPNFTKPEVTYARFRLTTDPSFSPLSPNSPSPTGPAINGEVEDYLIPVNPTAVTIGSVALTAQTAEGFLADLGADGMDTQALLDLLAAWDPAAAAALAGADREAILAALGRYLDPDGNGQVAVLAWDTLEQRGTVGFYVDRRVGDGDWQRINGDMLPALIGAPLGGEYRLADPTARAGERYEYMLIEQEAWGSTRAYGPFRLELAP